ncbi:ABC transporter substrate-binding protein [Methylobrevis pamukkalensis]|uniref:Heme-binding protein A n=1 Tax=Methylobrevis pamukkalensis TaxID=1439726 RepID=A0A1E3H632_9HYPH|nr:ABC transporter substrate-binding protein [Methylobrevis pamukkalensis]ODN71770.1 Heme-binding protein A precursor [Methylobrevis pamukkalensis]
MTSSVLSKWTCLLLAAAMTTAVASPAAAGKDDDTLNIAWEASIPTLDFYFLSIDEGYSVAQSVCDALVFRDPATQEIKPLLASAWEWSAPKQLDMTLRSDVKFHDGESFDADDVVYTLKWASDPATGVSGQYMVDWIAGVEKLGPDRIRITTKDDNKAVLDQLAAGVPIYPEHYHGKVGTEGFSRQPICSGPYKVESAEAGSSITLVRNEDYFEGSPKGKPAVGKVVIRSVQDANTRIAELMTGKIDWIYQLTADQAEKMKSLPGIRIEQVLGTRIAYLMFNPVNPPENSPVKDPKVRQAIAHAIDRDSLVNHLVRGVSVRLDTFCQPVMTGCIDKVFDYPYDVEAARKLLAEAGYAEGFDLDIFAYRDRHVTEALIGDLQKVGIRANLNYMQYSSLDENWKQGRLPIAHQTWAGHGLMDAGNHLSSHYLAPDSITTDERIKDLVREGNAGATQEARDEAYGKALALLAEGAYWVPLYIVTDSFAMSDQLTFAPSTDGIVRFYTAQWN